jgi:hypothetical protein
MELYPVAERFFQEFTLRRVLLNAAKNGCGPSAAGTSSRAEGYCRPCRDNELPCARGEPGANGRLCSYREHALISRQNMMPGRCCSPARASCDSRRAAT